MKCSVGVLQVEPTSPQPSVDRLSVTFAAEERSVCSDSSVRVNVMPASGPGALAANGFGGLDAPADRVSSNASGLGPWRLGKREGRGTHVNVPRMIVFRFLCERTLNV